MRQILETPFHISRFRTHRRTGWLRRLRRLFRKDSNEFEQALQDGDSNIFRKLDFGHFSSYVCDRFLVESGNPFHRYLLQVLLRYLFPEEREQVIHWLRKKPVRNHFLAKLQAKDEIDRHYKIFDSIKVLISLFTSDVSKGLHQTSGNAHPGTIFFFAFDQAEGRDALFDTPDDWSKFFAQLSELYNALPNVFILFTMTIVQRNTLHPKMEGQFKDRIRNDHRFVLRGIDAEEAQTLYKQRLRHWLQPYPDTLALFEQVKNPFLPFSREEMLRIIKNLSIRRMIEKLDEQFREALENLAIRVPLDYSVTFNEHHSDPEYDSPFQFTSRHLQTVESTLSSVGCALAEKYGILFTGSIWKETEDRLPVLQLEFRDVGDERRWVRIFLAQLTYQYANKLKGAIDLLAYRKQSSYQLWLVRCGPISIPSDTLGTRESQVATQELTSEAEAICQTVSRIWERGEPSFLDSQADDGSFHRRYANEDWAQGKPFLLLRVQETYLDSLFATACTLLQQSDTEAPPDEEQGLRSIARPGSVDAGNKE